MNDFQQVSLKKFKENKRKVYVDFVRNIVKWKNETFKLTYVNVGGDIYPYVILKDIKPLSEIKDKIKTVQIRKEELKNTEYDMNDDFYFVTGIGPEAIKASKNNNDEEYFRYNEEEGQMLLDVLMNYIGQSVL